MFLNAILVIFEKGDRVGTNFLQEICISEPFD